MTPPKSSQTVYRWMLKNKKNIAINLFPALFGGFGSMFVFLSGMSNVFNKIGYQQIAKLFEHPEAILIGLSIAFFITTYLAYFSIKSLYRFYKKDIAIRDSEKKITELELELIKINDIYKNIVKLFEMAKKLKLIFKIVKNIQNIDQSQTK